MFESILYDVSKYSFLPNCITYTIVPFNTWLSIAPYNAKVPPCRHVQRMDQDV